MWKITLMLVFGALVGAVVVGIAMPEKYSDAFHWSNADGVRLVSVSNAMDVRVDAPKPLVIQNVETGDSIIVGKNKTDSPSSTCIVEKYPRCFTGVFTMNAGDWKLVNDSEATLQFEEALVARYENYSFTGAFMLFLGLIAELGLAWVLFR